MSTGYSPIGLALRDVGAGFQGLLEQEARRRDQALTQQVALGQLGLQGQQLTNQAAAQQAQAGVSLAEVAARGRQQELQYGLEQKKLGFEERRVTEQEATGAAQRTYQQTALIPEATARTANLNQTAAAQRQVLEAGSQRVYLDQFENQITQRLASGGMPPDEIRQRVEWGKSIWDNISSAGEVRRDEAGRPYVTMAEAEARLKYTQELDKLNKGASLTPDQIQKHRESFLALAEKNPAMALVPMEDQLAQADALLLHPQTYYAETQRLLPPKIEAYRREKIAEFEKRNAGMFGQKPATAAQVEEIERKVVTPQVALWRAEIARNVLATRGGQREVTPTPTPTPAPPPAAGVTPSTKAELEQLAARHATAVGLRPAELQAIVDNENAGWEPGLANKQLGEEGGVGLGQNTKGFYRQYGREGGDRRDSNDNLEATARGLAQLKQYYNGDSLRAAAAFHAGTEKIPKEGLIPEVVIQQSSKGPFKQYPRAFAERYAAHLAKREQPQAPVATTSAGPPGLAASFAPVVPALGRAATTVGQAATNAAVGILSPTMGSSSAPQVSSPATIQGPSLAQATRVPPPTATSTPEQDAAYRAQNQGGTGLSQEGLEAFATQELQRRYPNGADDGVHAVNGGRYGTYLVYVQNGQIVRIEKGAA